MARNKPAPATQARPDPRTLDSLGRVKLDPPATADEVRAVGVKCGDSQESIDERVRAYRAAQ